MKKAIKVGIFLVSTTVSSFIFAQGNYVTPRTEWGQPDLQGVWNFSSNVPLQRAQRFGDREYMTTEEVAQMRAFRQPMRHPIRLLLREMVARVVTMIFG